MNRQKVNLGEGVLDAEYLSYVSAQNSTMITHGLRRRCGEMNPLDLFKRNRFHDQIVKTKEKLILPQRSNRLLDWHFQVQSDLVLSDPVLYILLLANASHCTFFV